MNEDRINLLAKKWLEGTLTEAERQEFERWYASFDDSEEIVNGEAPEHLGSRIYQNIILQRQPARSGVLQMSPLRWAAAAAVLLCLSFSAYLLLRPDKAEPGIAMQQTAGAEDIGPGSNRATLKLGDGSIVLLDDMEEGALKEQQGARFIKLDSGSLAYASSTTQTDKVSYNTLSTPRGGQFKLMLPDSSMVYLNAASSITFLTAFPADERRVEVTGEAYFEVKSDRNRPFRVFTGSATGRGQLIEVLGTQFNINTYADEEAVTTSLLEGSVQVMPLTGNGEIVKKSAGLLKPGQQSVLENGDLRVQEADVLSAIAWKNGLFQFREASLPEVMRQFSRWYDVDIVYEGAMPERKFTGKMYRNINASQALEILKFMKVNFRIEGKKIIVTP